MWNNNVRRLVLVALGFLAVTPASFAQDARTGTTLTDGEKTAITTILDDLATKQGDDLKQSILSVLDSLKQNSQSMNAVVRASKFGAGTNLPAFQSILVGACLGGDSKYCTLAALAADDPNQSDIQTAATGATGGGGDAGGLGGGAQTNSGHSNGSNSSSSGSSLFTAGQQDFGLSFTSNFSTTSGTTLTTSFLSTTTSLSTPSPLAGTGLPCALMLASFVVWHRGRQSVCK